MDNPTALYRSTIIFMLFVAAAIFSDSLGLGLTLITFMFVVATFILSSMDPDEIFRSIDWGVPFFVGSFFIFVEGLERSGVLSFIASVLAPLLRTDVTAAAPLLLLICAILSAFIDNIPVVILLYPVVKNIALEAGLRPLPLYWAMIIGSNLGGGFTPFGSPPVFIAVRILEKWGKEVGFGRFLKISAPLVLAQVASSMVYIAILTLEKLV